MISVSRVVLPNFQNRAVSGNDFTVHVRVTVLVFSPRTLGDGVITGSEEW